MKHLFLLSALASACFSANAGYALLAAPAAAVVTSGGVSTVAVGTAANAASYAGGYVTTSATLNLGARAITVPLAYRVAANAAAFAVTKMNPYVAGATLAAAAIPYVVDWVSGSGLEVSPEGVLQVPGSSPTPIDPPPGDYWVSLPSGERVLLSSVVPLSGRMRCTNGISAGWMSEWGSVCFADASPPTSPGVAPRPPNPGDLLPLEQTPINPALFPYIESPIPVEPVPVINPASQPIGDVVIGPSGNPAPAVQPAPLRVPDGEPIPIPNTSPQQYEQPWLEIVPAPTPAEPLRVDVRPITTVTTSPNAPPDPVTVPDTSTGNPSPTTGQTDCDKYPDSLGCIPVGEVPELETPTEERTLELQDGLSFGGPRGCPAPSTFQIAGRSVSVIEMTTACGWVSGFVRPLVLLLAAISAVFIVIPSKSSEV